MTKIERVQAALRGEAVDRPPYAFWTHMPGIDLDPSRLAEETSAFHERYDLDFIKSMPNGLYCVEDWGCVCDFSDIARGGVAKVTVPAITSASDWAALGGVDVTRGAYGRELAHLRALLQRVGAQVPVLATVFSPLTIAGKLSNGASQAHVREAPDALLRGLEVVTEVTCSFVREVLAAGCAGVFLAIQEATSEAMDDTLYRRFGEPYDDRVLDAARHGGGWFNVVHLHGNDILPGVLDRSQADAVNWHIGETPPTIAAYRARGGTRPIVGGLQRGHLTRQDRDAIEQDINGAMDQTGGRGILLAPACVIRHPVDEATLAWTAERIKALGRQAGSTARA